MVRTLLTLALVTSLCGCAMRNWLSPPPFSDRAPCTISSTVTKEQLIGHLNKNIQGTATSSGLAAWRSTSVKISATGMPAGFSAPASIAVEAPRNLRLRVSDPVARTEALDLGSNREQFWFWTKYAQPQQVITLHHTDLPVARRELQIPFDPDWLMEVMGVIPIDPARYSLKRGRADAPTLELIAEVPVGEGTAARKVIRVDACHGIIREHALYDGSGMLIARAALADHRIDQATGLIIPHVIRFDWRQTQQSMKLVLGSVELNPQRTLASTWQVPDKPGVPRLDLIQMLGAGGPEPSMYGEGSPFGMTPPPQQRGSSHIEPGNASAGTAGRTTYDAGNWSERAADNGQTSAPRRASRDHLRR